MSSVIGEELIRCILVDKIRGSGHIVSLVAVP